jgi:hypothetical protein
VPLAYPPRPVPLKSPPALCPVRPARHFIFIPPRQPADVGLTALSPATPNAHHAHVALTGLGQELGVRLPRMRRLSSTVQSTAARTITRAGQRQTSGEMPCGIQGPAG